MDILKLKEKTMSEPVISLKWVDDDLRQIKIIVADGQEPTDIVYPRPENCDGKAYGDVLARMFERISDLFERTFGRYDVYGPYGVFTNDSAILANLIKWQAKSNFVSVDPISITVRQNLEAKIKQLALGWGLSNASIDLESTADAFAKSTVRNFRWFFDFEISTAPKSLFNINKDALELEWYVLNHDKESADKKFAELSDEDKGIGSYKAHCLESCINAYARVADSNLS